MNYWKVVLLGMALSAWPDAASMPQVYMRGSAMPMRYGWTSVVTVMVAGSVRRDIG